MNRVGPICWSIVFYLLLALYSAASMPVLTLLVACQAPFTSRRHMERQFRRAIRWYGWPIIHVLPWPLVRVRFEALQPLPRAGARVVICNHRSSSEPFLMAALPLDEVVQVVNKWPMHLPVWGVVARLAGYLSIKEMTVDEFLWRAGALLRQGVSVVVFPEGTRAHGRDVGAFHGAAFRLCLQERVPIQPVCISGSERVPPRGSLVLHPGRVTLRALPPLPWEQYQHLTSFQLKNSVRDSLTRELASMEATA